MHPTLIEPWTKIFSELVPPIVAIIALCQYFRSVRTRRAEWLLSLFQSFYEGPSYVRTRAILDSDPRTSSDLSRLESDIRNRSEGQNVEAFINYLNCFEFVAVLRKQKQLRQTEICDLFKYYLQNLKKLPFVTEYVKNQGFERLDRLLDEIDPKPARSRK